MIKLLSIFLSFFLLIPTVSIAADEDILNLIQELLDDELSTWDDDSIYVEEPDEELEDSIARIHEMGITKYGTIDTYMAHNNIRRDEAATMFLRFAEYHDLLGTALVNDCNFPDLGSAHSDLTDEIVDACEAGLFQGSNGYFLPTSAITNAAAITVMARILDGKKNENGTHWADNYYNVLDDDDLMDNLPMESRYSTYGSPITRGDIAILLTRADKLQ